MLGPEKGVFLYKNDVKGYIMLAINIREIFISRNVIFYENVFSYKSLQNNQEAYTNEEIELFFLMTFYVVTTLLKYKAPLRVTTMAKCLLKMLIPIATITQILLARSEEDHSHKRTTRVRKTPRYLNDYIH